MYLSLWISCKSDCQYLNPTVWTIRLATMVKDHLNSNILVRYSRHGLNNGPFNEWTVLDHLNTKLVCYSDPRCIRLDMAIQAREATNSDNDQNTIHFCCCCLLWSSQWALVSLKVWLSDSYSKPELFKPFESWTSLVMDLFCNLHLL